MRNNRPVFYGVSAVGHMAAIAALIYIGHADTSGAVAPAPPTIELLLPPAMPAAAAVPVEAAEVKPVEAVETPPEVQEVVEPEPPPPLPVMADAVEAVEEAPVLVAKAPEPEKPKPPKPKPRRETKKPEKPKEEPVTEAAAPPQAAATAAPPGLAPSAAQGAAPVSGGGNPGAKQDFKALVLAWIEKHKRYPESARRRGIEGKPTVRFRIDRSGRVLLAELQRETGRRDLDEAAVRTIERADPFPAFPADLTDQTMEFTVPIDFSMRR
jgi:protein TonB